jgi:hypothetical protein
LRAASNKNTYGTNEVYLRAPTTGDMQRFFDDFHAHLREQGVDFVKVDAQASFDLVTDGRVRANTFVQVSNREF